jgi:hypothetical protein
MTRTERAIYARLAEIGKEQSELYKKIEDIRANKQIKCGCGKTHRIKNCVAVQTHWYEGPSGCIGGDMWHEGELHFVCPETGDRNRLLFSNNDVPYDKREEFVNNAERQFKSRYTNLFKEVVQEHKRTSGSSWNNYYVDQNHEKFGLKIELRDYTKKK